MKYVGEKATTKLVSLIKSNIKKKLDKNQGTANSGKILSVDTSGEVAPTDTEIATLVDVPNGIVKGDGSTLSAAVAGTDYMAPPTSGTAGQVLKKTETGTEWADALRVPGADGAGERKRGTAGQLLYAQGRSGYPQRHLPGHVRQIHVCGSGAGCGVQL